MSLYADLCQMLIRCHGVNANIFYQPQCRQAIEKTIIIYPIPMEDFMDTTNVGWRMNNINF